MNWEEATFAPSSAQQDSTNSYQTPLLRGVSRGEHQNRVEPRHEDVRARAVPDQEDQGVGAGDEVSGERACLTLPFATLITAAEQWRGVRMMPKILRTLDALCAEGIQQAEQATA